MKRVAEINSAKIILKDVFKLWFRIPEYQRPYVWGREEVHDLLEDLTFAERTKPDSQYFLGTIVFQSKQVCKDGGQEYTENDLLDGQQRLTTLLLLLAVIRDTTSDRKIKGHCQVSIFEEADAYDEKPERMRLVFDIRETVKKFVDDYVKVENGTKDLDALRAAATRANYKGIANMVAAIETIKEFFASEEAPDSLEAFFTFLRNKVLMIYVSTEDLDDAFRLFTILNNRGVPLRNSDILKSINLGALGDSQAEKVKYAKMWEEAEGELGDEFDRFLSHIRTILVKEKARMTLLREFEDCIYDPKEKDKKTGKLKPVLLQKGKPTFELVEKYLGHYKQLLSGPNTEVSGNYAFDNLVKVMMANLPSTDWIPPLLRYYNKFGNRRLLEFLTALNRKFGGDWLSQKTPTDRIESMNAVIRAIDNDTTNNPDTIFSSSLFDFDTAAFSRALEGAVYGKKFALYVLLILDYAYQNQVQKMHFETLSVEHVLPQNPSPTSQWVKDFTEEQRKMLTDTLGNLVIITRRKNASQSNRDYVEKKVKYFEKNIDTCPNSLRILQNIAWTPSELDENQKTVMDQLKKYFALPA